MSMPRTEPWPKLDFTSWQPTGDAIHRWLQIVGKYRLAATPWVNHGWQATFYVSPRGIRTGSIPVRDRVVEFTFDFCDHALVGTNDLGKMAFVLFKPMSVAQFHRKFVDMANELRASLDFHGRPNEVPHPVPFVEDREERPYNSRAVGLYHRALIDSDRVLRHFRTGFLGKASPVHLFWGSFDLAVTRFSGREAPLHPGGVPSLPDEVTREAYSHEVSSCGFWAGGSGVNEAAFYSYAYPAPGGFPDAPVSPSEAFFHEELGQFILPYEKVRSSTSPDESLMSFLESTWRAASRLGNWPEELECSRGVPGVPRR